MTKEKAQIDQNGERGRNLTKKERQLFDIVRSTEIPSVKYPHQPPSDEQTYLLDSWGIAVPHTKATAGQMIDYVRSAEGLVGEKYEALFEYRIIALKDYQKRYPYGSIVAVREGRTWDFAKVVAVKPRDFDRKLGIHDAIVENDRTREVTLIDFELIILRRGGAFETKSLRHIKLLSELGIAGA